MATLAVLKFHAPEGAEQTLRVIESLGKQELVTLQDAAIVTWPVRNKLDLSHVALAIRAGSQFIQQCADGLYNLNIGLLVPASDVVRLTGATCFQNTANRAAVIFDIEPVADLLTVAVDR